MSATLEQIDARLARIEAALGTVAGIATRRVSRATLAKKAGCSVRTLQRRERKARANLLAQRLVA